MSQNEVSKATLQQMALDIYKGKATSGKIILAVMIPFALFYIWALFNPEEIAPAFRGNDMFGACLIFLILSGVIGWFGGYRRMIKYNKIVHDLEASPDFDPWADEWIQEDLEKAVSKHLGTPFKYQRYEGKQKEYHDYGKGLAVWALMMHGFTLLAIGNVLLMARRESLTSWMGIASIAIALALIVNSIYQHRSANKKLKEKHSEMVQGE